MTDDVFESLDLIHRLESQGRFRSVLERFQHLLSTVHEPGKRIVVCFEYGEFNWMKMGDGNGARQGFLGAAECGAHVPSPRDELEAAVCENLMLLSLSFEEYLKWAEELRKREPNCDILRGQVPMIVDLQDRGQPWWSTMKAVIAQSYYSRSAASIDRGHYGQGAATYQLLLTNRKTFRLPRYEWRQMVEEYSALLIKLSADTAATADASGAGCIASEVQPILQKGAPLICECVDEYSEDLALQAQWKKCQNILTLKDDPSSIPPVGLPVQAANLPKNVERPQSVRPAAVHPARPALSTAGHSRLAVFLGIGSLAIAGCATGVMLGGSSGTHLIASIIVAVLIHLAPETSPSDHTLGNVEKKYLTGTTGRIIWLLFLYEILSLLAGMFDRWWMPVLLAIPGGTILRFLLINLAVRMGIMSLSETLANRSFSGQIRDVASLIHVASRTNSEILVYLEPPARPTDPMGQMLLIDLFRRNPRLGIAHGKGRGHAFVRVVFLQEILRKAGGRFDDYASMVEAFRANGYEVVRSDLACFE